MGKSSSFAAPKQQPSSSRDTSKSSSGGSKFTSSSGSRYGKPEIHTYPDGRRPGHEEKYERAGDARYHKDSGLTKGSGGSRR